MKVRDLINITRLEIYNGVVNNDTTLSNHFLYNVINNARNFLIVDKLNKKQPLDYTLYNTIQVKLEETELDDCKLLKSTCKIPKIISSIYGDKIVSVTTNRIELGRIKYQDILYEKYNRYTSGKPVFFFLNDYLYVKNNLNIKKVKLTAVFEDLYEVEEYKVKCGFKECNELMDKIFPASSNAINKMLDYIRNSVIKRKQDFVNNEIDE